MDEIVGECVNDPEQRPSPISKFGSQMSGNADEERWHIFVTGHSMGGAKATLCAYELAVSHCRASSVPVHEDERYTIAESAACLSMRGSSQALLEHDHLGGLQQQHSGDWPLPRWRHGDAVCLQLAVQRIISCGPLYSILRWQSCVAGKSCVYSEDSMLSRGTLAAMERAACNLQCMQLSQAMRCTHLQAKEWKNVPAPKVTMVSFGQPRVGNMPFARDYGTLPVLHAFLPEAAL